LAHSLRFAIPGDIETRTGGTIYDKRVMTELRLAGWAVEHLQWPASFPFPDDCDVNTVAESLAACPDGSLVMIDGLAFGVLPDLVAKEARRLRLVALVHHPLALETGLSSEVEARLADLERRALEHACAVVVTSEMTARTLTAQYGVPTQQITVAKPGVDWPAEIPHPRNTTPQLLTVGTVTPRKGHDTLVDALSMTADLKWRCTIAGSLERSPETTAAIRKRIAGYGLDSRIALIGEVPDPEPLYRTSDLFVLPSRYEGYGMAIAEALAFGIPVVATSVGAIPEVVPPGAGILVPADDPTALAGALRQLLVDERHRERLTRGALAAALGLAEWRDTADLVASALDAVQ